MSTNDPKDGTLIVRYGSIASPELTYIVTAGASPTHIYAQRGAIPGSVTIIPMAFSSLEVTEQANLPIALNNFRELDLISPCVVIEDSVAKALGVEGPHQVYKKWHIEAKQGLFVNKHIIEGMDVHQVVKELKDRDKYHQLYSPMAFALFTAIYSVSSLQKVEEFPGAIPLEELLKKE